MNYFVFLPAGSTFVELVKSKFSLALLLPLNTIFFAVFFFFLFCGIRSGTEEGGLMHHMHVT